MAYNKNRISYIYRLINPLNGVVFYVGATIDHKARKSNHCSNPLTTTGIELKNKGLEPIFNIIEECKMGDVPDREIYWINEHKSTIENSQKKSSGGLKGGRKPLKDKKELIRVYLRQSEIKKLGGHKKAASKLHTLAMLELSKHDT